MAVLAAKMEEEANLASQEENRKRKIEQVNLDDDEQPVKKQKIQNQDADDDIVEGMVYKNDIVLAYSQSRNFFYGKT